MPTPLGPANGTSLNTLLTTLGDLPTRDAVGPVRLPLGSVGTITRATAAGVQWQELVTYGTTAARPAASASVVGQWYWLTDGAAGLELTHCVRSGVATWSWQVVPYGVTATGAALVSAASAAAARSAIGVTAAWDTSSEPTRITTQNDTPTTLLTVPVATYGSCAVKATLSAGNLAKTVSCSWEILVNVRNASGVVTIVDYVVEPTDLASVLVVTPTFSGTNVLVSVTGVVSGGDPNLYIYWVGAYGVLDTGVAV